MCNQRKRISYLAWLVLIVPLCAAAVHAQTTAQTIPSLMEEDCSQLANTLSSSSAHAEGIRFITCFARQSPAERIKLWQQGTNSITANTEMEELLIGQGTDTALLLARFVQDKEFKRRLHALKLLCDMDRFVSTEQLPSPLDVFQNKQVNGMLNAFMLVDGRRIGSEAFGIVKWAAEQNEDADLRFYARKYSGLLDKDLVNLSLPEALKQWREAVIECQGREGSGSRASSMMYHLEKILIARAPESLPALTDMLEHDSNSYTREQAIGVIEAIDNRRVRLRGIEQGRRAIEAVRLAIARGELKPTYVKKQWRTYLWENLEAQFMRDYWFVHDEQNQGISQAWDFYANSLDEIFKTGTTIFPVKQPDMRPTIRQFVTYLTELDPYYPSWEYIDFGPPWDGLCHPRFQQKMMRYDEAWKRFTAAQRNSHS